MNLIYTLLQYSNTNGFILYPKQIMYESNTQNTSSFSKYQQMKEAKMTSNTIYLMSQIEPSLVQHDNTPHFLMELSTEEYEDLRLHIGYTLKVLGSSVQLFLSGRNLTDDEQRYHTSFIKDLAPQPGPSTGKNQ